MAKGPNFKGNLESIRDNLSVPILQRHAPVTLEPRGEYIVIRMVAADRTEAGLVRPDSADEYKKAIVIACGPGKTLDDGTLKRMHTRVGDRVLLLPGAARGNDITGEVLYMARDEDVIATIVETSAIA